jgi:hypothetical protein
MLSFHPSQVRIGTGPRRFRDRNSNSNSKGKGHQMSAQMASAKIKPESVGDVQAATERMFAAINRAQPEGIRCASLLLADGETFVAVVQVDDGVENPIPGFLEFRELQELVEGSRAEPPSVEPLTVVGSYRLF